MKSLITIISLLFSISSFASNGEINLDMKLKIDDRVVATPKVVTVDGMPVTISSTYDDNQKGFFIEITPTLKENQVVFLDFKVYETTKGIKKLISSPKVETILGRSASLSTETNESFYKKMELSINTSI